MDDRSSAVPDADCGAARGTREEAASECKKRSRSAYVNDKPSFRYRPEGDQERSAISLVGIVLQAIFMVAVFLGGPAAAAPE
jgi:hypothetical protein